MCRSLPDTVRGQNGDNLCDKRDSFWEKKKKKKDSNLMLLIWNLFTYCKSLVELKNINVIQGQSSPFQDFRCAVRWPGMKKIKIKKNRTCSLINHDQPLTPILRPPSWKPEHSPQKQLIFGVLRHVKKISKMQKKKKKGQQLNKSFICFTAGYLR